MNRHEILKVLHRIESKIDMLLSQFDLSKEDAQVKAMTEQIEEAQQKLPPQPKE